MTARFPLVPLAVAVAAATFAGCSSDDSEAGGAAGTGGTSATGGTGGDGGGGTGAYGAEGGTGPCNAFGPSIKSAKAAGTPGLFQLVDVDCDGKLDVVSTTWSANTSGSEIGGGLSVRRAKGDGSFEPATSLDLGMGPAGLVAGDFDGDAVPDIVVAGGTSYGIGRLSLVRGDCEKGFQAPVTLVDPSPYSGMDFASGDLNDDGIADVVMSRWDAPYTVDVLFGGATPLKNKLTSPALPDQPTVLVVADVDGDGHRDVAVAGLVGDEASSLQVLRNDGAGNLTKGAYVPVAGSLVRMVALDLDGDGADELVTFRAFSSLYDNQAFVDAFHFDPNSGELSAQPLADEPEAAFLAVGDVDADGHADLALGWPSSKPPHTEILFGGSSAPPVVDVPFAGSDPFRFGDVTGDGRVDLVTLLSDGGYSPASISLEVFPAKSLECQHQAATCGGSSAFGETAYPLTLPAERLVFGDVTGDGAKDIVVVGKDALGVLTNDGQGSFQAGPRADIPGIIAVSVGRVGPSGAPVVVVTDGSAGWTTLDAQGNLQKVSQQGFESTGPIAAGDMTGDGKDDLAVSTGTGLFVLPSADPAAAFKWSTPSYSTQLLGALDFDDDGDTDLLVRQSQGEASHRCLIRAPVKASTPCEPLPGKSWSQLDVGDFDGDHQADFLSLGTNGGVSLDTAAGNATTLLTPSEGWFSARVMQRQSGAALLLGLKGGELRVYAGEGDGKLSSGPPLFRHWTDRLLRYVDAEDLDGDGRDELVGIAWDPPPVLWVLEECQ